MFALAELIPAILRKEISDLMMALLLRDHRRGGDWATFGRSIARSSYFCLLLALISTAWMAAPTAATVADEPARLHEARFVYHIDHGAVPTWVQVQEVTLVIDVGPALGVVAAVGGDPVPCRYKDGLAYITTDATEVEVIVSAPARPLAEMGSVTLATLRDDKAWALSITLDDGYTSQATTAKALLDRYGYRSTIAVTGSRIGTVFEGHNYASAAELQAVVEDGWHLGNHTYSHRYASELGNERNILRDVRLANESITAAVPGYAPLLFTSPYTDRDYTSVIKGHTDELGLWLIQVVGFEAIQADPGSFRYSGQPFVVGRTQLLNDRSQFDNVQTWLAANPGKHYWLSLHTHEVSPVCDCLETSTDSLYRTYGAGGLDNVWVAPAQEVFEYLVVRDTVTVRETSRNMVGAPPPGFALSAPAPEPTIHRAVFQQGSQGYDGVQDTFIDESNPNSGYGSDWGLKVRSPSPISSLIRYDLNSLPKDIRVQDAVLRLYGIDETNDYALCIGAYPLLRPWTPNATWKRAASDQLWALPGASAPGEDRSAEHTGTRALAQGKNRWYELDIRQAVQDWVKRPESNQGVLLVAGGEVSKGVTLASSNHGTAQFRPTLVISYTLPAGSPVVDPQKGNGTLMGRVLWSGRAQPPAASWSTPVTLTLYEAGRETPVWWGSTSSGTNGEFAFSQLPTGSFDLALETRSALSVVVRGLQIHAGPNRLDLGPLTEGDVVHDGYIDARDWAALRQAWGSTAGAADYQAAADLNGDGQVNDADAAILQQSYGMYGAVEQPAPSAPGGASVVLRLSPVQARVQLGAYSSFDVLVDAGGQAVDGADFWIEFDPSFLRVVSVTPTGALPWLLERECDFDGYEGVLRFVAGSLGQPVRGPTSLLRVTFEGKRTTGSLGAEITFGSTPEHTNYITSAGYNVLTNTVGAKLMVEAVGRLHLPIILKSPVSAAPLASGSPHREEPRGDERISAAALHSAIDLPIVGHAPLRPFPMDASDAGARDVRVLDDQAYLVVTTYYEDQSRFFYRLDVEDPTNPRLDSYSSGSGFSRDPDEVWLEGGRAYVAKKTRGVDILGISGSSEMQYLGTYYAAGPVAPIAKGIHAVGDRLYVADEAYGLQIVDVSNPASPKLMGEVGNIFGEGVWCDGTVAYVAADYPGVYVVDVSDPRRPHLLLPEALGIPGEPPGRAVDVQVEDGLLYVAAEHRGIAIFDIDPPAASHLLGTLDTGFAQKVDVVDHIVYVVDDAGGLLVVDATDPQNMRIVGRCDTPGRAFGVDVDGRYVYVADGKEGLQVVDLAPLTPTPGPTETPTITPSPTVTATPSRTVTPTPSDSRVTLPIFLRPGIAGLSQFKE